MKKNLIRNLFVAALVYFGAFISDNSSAQAGMCADCGSYVVVPGSGTVFFCGNNGNDHCLRPCGPTEN